MNITTVLLLGALLGGDDDKPGSKAQAPMHQPARTAPTVEVRCRSQALVRGVDVLLQDVADVATDDPVLAARLAEVSFGRRPARGFNRTLPQTGVRAQLSLAGLALDQFSVSGASETVVQSVHATVQPQELIDVAEPILRAALDQEPQDVEFELATKLMAIEVPPGRRSFDLRGRLRGDVVQTTSAVVEVAVMVDDAEFKVVGLPYRLRRFGKALVVIEPVRREAPLSPQVLEVKRLELSPGAETLHVADFERVRGMVAARDLRRGQVLRLSDLAAPAVIRPKDPVVVVIDRGRVQVTTRGIALRSAAVGDRVDVVTGNGRILQAVARGTGVVAVETEVLR